MPVRAKISGCLLDSRGVPTSSAAAKLDFWGSVDSPTDPDSLDVAAAEDGCTRGPDSHRSGNSGGRKAKIITQAESATPSPTSEPNCAKPGSPPKFSTRKAVIVVTAAQKMLGAIPRRIWRMERLGWASASW